MKELQLELNDLKLRELGIRRRLREDELSNTSEREAIKRRIAQLEARLENGCLELFLPRAEEEKSRTIPIRVNKSEG